MGQSCPDLCPRDFAQFLLSRRKVQLGPKRLRILSGLWTRAQSRHTRLYHSGAVVTLVDILDLECRHCVALMKKLEISLLSLKIEKIHHNLLLKRNVRDEVLSLLTLSATTSSGSLYPPKPVLVLWPQFFFYSGSLLAQARISDITHGGHTKACWDNSLANTTQLWQSLHFFSPGLRGSSFPPPHQQTNFVWLLFSLLHVNR